MNKVELSEYMRANYPADKKSVACRKLVSGIGTNDSDYVTQIRPLKLRCPAYDGWASMLSRVNSKNYHEKFPTYDNVDICHEWLSFMTFRKWWIENHVDGWEIDKDLISANKKYSPENCIFIPNWLNTFAVASDRARGKYPIGVNFDKESRKYKAQCSRVISGVKKRVNLGRFNTPIEAYNAWERYKLGLALAFKPRMDVIDKRLYPNVVSIIKGHAPK